MAALLMLLGVRGLSPILARSLVVLSISAVWSIGPAVCPVIFFSVTWVFCGPRLSVCLRHGTFRFGPTPRQHDQLQRGLLLSCVFASCSSCSLALVVMAAAEWGKKRGGSSDPAANSATECQLSRQGDTYLLEVWPWAQRNEATRRRVHTTFAAGLRP